MVVLVLATLLAGCAGPAALLVNQDLTNATTMAKGANDAQAASCYEAIAKANTGGVVGIFGMNEQLRILAQAQGPCAGVLLITPPVMVKP